MDKVIILFFLFAVNIQVYSQLVNDWVLFEDENTESMGYKDLQENIKIEPKFVSLVSAKVFRNIIPVIEETKDGDLRDYYLLKNEKIIGIDSLYIFDYTLDCESEDKIRFRDKVTDKVGFFNKEGKVVIPALYNDVRPFYNHLALAIKDARRLCWEGVEYSKENPCEHWSWDGNTVLINTNNEIVLDNLALIATSYLDWYSLKINQSGLDDTYVNFKNKKGDTYSFIDFNKQFEKWFYHDFLLRNRTDQLERYLFEDITFGKEQKWKSKKEGNAGIGWGIDSKINFLSANKRKIYKVLDKVNYQSFETIISNGYSPITFEYDSYKDYFTDCGEYNNVKYPYFTVNIVHEKSKEVIHSLGFIKTLEGTYKLLEISN